METIEGVIHIPNMKAYFRGELYCWWRSLLGELHFEINFC